MQWAKPKALAFVGLYELRETEAVITWVREEMAERVRLYSRYGVGNIKDLDPAAVPEDACGTALHDDLAQRAHGAGDAGVAGADLRIVVGDLDVPSGVLDGFAGFLEVAVELVEHDGQGA